MKCIVLAAGYATRLWPLTKNRPKGLLEVGNRPLVEHTLNEVLDLKDIDKVYVVTNNKFYPNFKKWSENFNSRIPIKIINDGTASNEDRLGAIGDLNFVIEKENIKDDILVINSDTLQDFSLKPVYDYFQKQKENLITITDVKTKRKAKKGLVVEIDENNKIIDCKEKPKRPKTTLYSMTIFFFPKKTLPKIDKYLKKGNDPDAPGHFPEWLCKRDDIFAYKVDGKTIDVGTPERLKKARKLFY